MKIDRFVALMNATMRNLILAIFIVLLGKQPVVGQDASCAVIDSITLHVSIEEEVKGRFVNQRGPDMAGAQMEFGEWHHLAVTKSDNSGKVFLNGQIVGEGPWSGDPYSWGSLFLASELYTGWDVFYHGYIDDIRVSAVVRSDEEILQVYLTQSPHVLDEHTQALWRFDEVSGSQFANEISSSGFGDLYNGASFELGLFGNCVFFDGFDDRANCNFNPSENNFTIELWLKPLENPNEPYMCFLQPYGAYNSPMFIVQDTIMPELQWSTGDSTGTLTLNPADFPFVWVTDGVCTDTIWFDSSGTTYQTVYDTVLVSVVDTLVINVSDPLLLSEFTLNTIKVYPNPANDHIYIDYGDFSSMFGYLLKIENALGQQMFQTQIEQQLSYVSLADWTGNGLYFVYIMNPQGETIEVKKIILQ